jgi:hypothetical protein
MTDKFSADVEAAVAARDGAALSRLLDAGLDANWTGAGGQTLLHWAARLGDLALTARLLDAGAHARVYNDAAETPRDVAVIWGHDLLAAKIAARAAQEPEGAEAFPYRTLEEIREKSRETGVNQFHYLAQRGQFAKVIALAAEDPQGIDAADLLGRGLDGDTALLKICQQGQLRLLARPDVWLRRPQEFQSLWEKVPAHYRKEIDHDQFVGQLRQMKLQSYGKLKPRGFKK